MDNQIKYTVTAEDLLSGKLNGMNANATKLEGTLATVGKTATSMGSKLVSGLGMLGVGFAAFKGFELIHEGVEAVEKLHQAQAQVKAGLESTGYVAGLTAESLDKMAKTFSQSTKYSRADITDLQSLMLTFPAITKETFPQATQAILDMSTRLGQDTKSSAIQLGKALQDPIRGITALRRVGVNFSDSQKEVIQKLVDTGQTAKAQTLILSELTTEFGGSAKAAFDADPLAKYNKMMASMKMAMGEAGMEILEALQPALLVLASGVKYVANGIKQMIEFVKENKEIFQALGVAILAGATAWGIYTVASGLAGVEMMLMNGVATLLSGTMFILENILTFGIPIAIGIVVGAIAYCYMHFAKFRAFLYGLWEALQVIGGLIGQFFTGLKDVIVGAFTFDKDQITKGLMSMAGAFQNAGKKIGAGFNKGYTEGMADFNKDHPKEKETKKGLTGVKPIATGIKPTTEDKTKGVTGTKNVTINIAIGSLIHDFKINTTNIQESAKAIHDKVTQALTSAVNDSQIVAGQ